MPAAPIFSTARRAASCIETDRSAYSMPYLLEDLEALVLPGARDAEDRDLLGRVVAELDARLDHAAGDDVDAGVGDDRHHHGDLVDARLLQHELGQAAGLRDRRVAADLAVVGRLAAVGADGVEQRQRAAAGADHEAEVAVELGDVAGDAAVVLGVDGLAGELERRSASRAWRVSSSPTPSSVEQLLAGAPRASFSMSMCASSATNEPSCELAERVDLGERHVVVDEQPGQPGEDRRQPVERRAGDADRGDHLLGLEVGRTAGCSRSARAADVVGVLLGDLLDVDAAHVARRASPAACAVPSQTTPA